MALEAKQAKRDVTREVKLKSGVPGFPDRVFVYKLTTSGKIEVREKGDRGKKRVVKIEEFIKWAVVHVREIE